jgi:hypothetical protein
MHKYIHAYICSYLFPYRTHTGDWRMSHSILVVCAKFVAIERRLKSYRALPRHLSLCQPHWSWRLAWEKCVSSGSISEVYPDRAIFEFFMSFSFCFVFLSLPFVMAGHHEVTGHPWFHRQPHFDALHQRSRVCTLRRRGLDRRYRHHHVRKPGVVAIRVC